MIVVTMTVTIVVSCYSRVGWLSRVAAAFLLTSMVAVSGSRAEVDTWLIRHQGAPGSPTLWGIAPGPAGLIAVGERGTILKSLDKSTWTSQTGAGGVWLLSVAYGNAGYVAVGDQGVILFSVDGERWNRVGAGLTSQRLNRVQFGAGRYVAVGEGETILTSTDGVAWTVSNSGGTHWLRALAKGGRAWIAAGESGIAYSSTNGIDWSRQTIGTNDIEAAVYRFTNIPPVGAASPELGMDLEVYFAVGGSNGTFGVTRVLVNAR